MGYVVHFKKKDRTEMPSSWVSANSTRWKSPWVDSARAQPFQDCTWHAYGHAHTTCRVGPLLFNRTMFFGWRQWTSSYPSYIDVRGPKLGNPKILWLIIICPMKVWMYTMINPCIPHFVGNPHVNHSRSTGRRPWRWPLCRNLWKARRKEMEHGA